MRVLHVISSISRQGGGPSRSSQGLVAGLRAEGVDAWLMTLSKGEEPWIKGVDKFVNGGDFADALARVGPDIVHIHGIWQTALHRCAALCRKAKVPYVIAPRGMLEPWSLRAKWLKKRIARFLYQDRDLRKAAALHATAESEAEQFRKLGFRNYCIISPNGVNLPEEKVGKVKAIGQDTAHRALFVSRMHPKKGVLELVESWARVKASGTVVCNSVTANWYDVAPAAEITHMPVVEVSPSIAPCTDKRAIKDLFKAFGEVENAADGRRVTFPAKSVGKIMGQHGVDLYRLAGSFADLFKSSRRAWSESEATIANHKRHRNIDAYHQYIAKFRNGADECYARFTVREDKGGRTGRNEIHSSTVSRIVVYKAKGAELSDLGHAQAEDSTPFVDKKISYFLNRVNPLENWVCELVYTLNGEAEKAYEAQVKQRILDLGMSYQDKDGTLHSTTTTSNYNFIFTGPLDDDRKWEAYARADLFVLPTYSENFGIVIAEALWAGVPVITTKGTPWSELEGSSATHHSSLVTSHSANGRCGWWIDLPGEKVEKAGGGGQWRALDAALREATQLFRIQPSTFDLMRQNGHALVESKYTWKAVCKAMVHGYEKVGNEKLRRGFYV